MEPNKEGPPKGITGTPNSKPVPVNFELFPDQSKGAESKSEKKYQPEPQILSTFQISHTETHLTTMNSFGNEIAPTAKYDGKANSQVPSWKDLRPLKINVTNFQGLVCVHFDPFILSLPPTYSEAIGTLNFKHFGHDLRKGQECISDLKSARIFLISSGGMGAQIVPNIHDLPQVYAIYIHCEDVDGHKQWAKKFPKVRVVCFDDKRELLPLLAIDAARCHYDWGEALLEAGQKENAIKRYKKALEKLDKSTINDSEMRKMITEKLQSIK